MLTVGYDIEAVNTAVIATNAAEPFVVTDVVGPGGRRYVFYRKLVEEEFDSYAAEFMSVI